ncbi:adenosylcobinamide amidohydrolase [Paenibacillus sp. UNC451MF]|uniref:adenosylcobinamide amidohydrolase n=1 Tax=Paenibacillus sp. UNC451MF TaxID=1449063 RepID=UPI00068C1101|nr:adenosylcobinamide amidohydrolase [Paenibacillus sp. UNC451MF]
MTDALPAKIPITSIANITFHDVEDELNSFYVIESSRPLRTINSSMWGEGLGWHSRLMNRQVDRNYLCDDPLAEMHDFMRERGIGVEDTAALLTAARVQDRGYSKQCSASGLTVCTWATVGLSNKARAGSVRNVDELFPGTINLITIIDGTLTDAAMVNAVITATEAKAAALQDANIRLHDSEELATGTTTDAVLIAATQKGPSYRYAGTATQLGYCIGKTVYDAVQFSLKCYEAWQQSKRN